MTTNTFNAGIGETMAVIVQHGNSLVKVQLCCAGWVLIGSTCRSLGSHLKDFGLSRVSGTTDTSCISLSEKKMDRAFDGAAGRPSRIVSGLMQNNDSLFCFRSLCVGWASMELTFVPSDIGIETVWENNKQGGRYLTRHG